MQDPVVTVVNTAPSSPSGTTAALWVQAEHGGQRYAFGPFALPTEAEAVQSVLRAKLRQLAGDPGWRSEPGVGDLEAEWLDYIAGHDWEELVWELDGRRVEEGEGGRITAQLEAAAAVPAEPAGLGAAAHERAEAAASEAAALAGSAAVKEPLKEAAARVFWGEENFGGPAAALWTQSRLKQEEQGMPAQHAQQAQQLEVPVDTAMGEAQQPGTAQQGVAGNGAEQLGMDAGAARQPAEVQGGAPEVAQHAAGVGAAGAAVLPPPDTGPGQPQYAVHAAQEDGHTADGPAVQAQQGAPHPQARMQPWGGYRGATLHPAPSTGLFGVIRLKYGFRMQLKTPFGNLRIGGLRSAEQGAALHDTVLLWREMRRGKEDDLDKDGGPLDGAVLLLPAPEDLPPRFNKPAQTYLGDAALMAFLSRASYGELKAQLQREAEGRAGEAGASGASDANDRDDARGSMLERQGGASSSSRGSSDAEEEEETRSTGGPAGRHRGTHPKLTGVRQQGRGRAAVQLSFQGEPRWLGIYDSAAKAGCVRDVAVVWRALQLGKDPGRATFNYPHLGLAGDAALLAQLRALPDIPSLRTFLAGWAPSHLSALMARLQAGGGGLPGPLSPNLPPSPAAGASPAAGGVACESKGGESQASSGAGAGAAGAAGPPAKRARYGGGSHSALPLQTPATAPAAAHQPAAAALKANPGAAAAAAHSPSYSVPAVAAPGPVAAAAAAPAGTASSAGPPSAYGMLDQLQPTLEPLLPSAALLEFELAFPGFPPPKQRALWRAIQRAAGLGNAEAVGKLVRDAMQDG